METLELEALKGAQTLLQHVTAEAKRLSGVMNLAGKTILTDGNLSESLKTGAGTMLNWERTGAALVDKLEQECDAIHDRMASAKSLRKALLVDKRKLQMEVSDLKKKHKQSEERLEKVLAGVEAVDDDRRDAAENREGGAAVDAEEVAAQAAQWQKRVLALEAMLEKKTADEEELARVRTESSALQEQVATLTTEVEFNADAAKQMRAKIAELEELVESGAAAGLDGSVQHASAVDLSKAKQAAPPKRLGDKKPSVSVPVAATRSEERDDLENTTRSNDGSTPSTAAAAASASADKKQVDAEKLEKIRSLTARPPAKESTPFYLKGPVLGLSGVLLFGAGFAVGTLGGADSKSE